MGEYLICNFAGLIFYDINTEPDELVWMNFRQTAGSWLFKRIENVIYIEFEKELYLISSHVADNIHNLHLS